MSVLEGFHYNTYLECNIGIFMHSKYLWFITEWKAFHIVPVCLNSISIRSIVDTYRIDTPESCHSNSKHTHLMVNRCTLIPQLVERKNASRLSSDIAGPMNQ